MKILSCRMQVICKMLGSSSLKLSPMTFSRPRRVSSMRINIKVSLKLMAYSRNVVFSLF